MRCAPRMDAQGVGPSGPNWRVIVLLALLAAACCVVLGGCGQARRFGDQGGQPAAFEVALDRAFISGMYNRQGSPHVGIGTGWSSRGGLGVGTGVGLSFSATSVSLLGSEGPGGSEVVFRQELKWGDNH